MELPKRMTNYWLSRRSYDEIRELAKRYPQGSTCRASMIHRELQRREISQRDVAYQCDGD